ncbi:ABC transporter ATP-binding protein [Clostridium septicum]|uniref:ABC transporter ATP-binding protein n=1 Tax=Clostridium septicum TaxID=1504 RepID=A0A9N7JNA3_CLOSE|nr:ABC transporter ATP-binding protein [Clostridium septicum]AYE34956.1 ABC transporter ATP-binding protein [Clostridium septicum]MDU1315177.1 ABC transporter ATP-binding protein [Clostridium septicum]QAS60351.1 ABC transporter ATP-binding protein [Clostridium septicum]UEC20394.1 ABC transporter ATP-binding protein [Clostridium septicum]USS01551.1 ABC transporter ATP-binding protein [Clostridium septicum]
MEINCKDIEVKYGDYKAVKGVDAALYKGVITTIIGPNGSGKSTFLKAITRLLRRSNGSVHINDKSIEEFKGKDLSKMIAVLPQRHCAPPDFKVEELVSYGRMPHKKWYDTKTDYSDQIVNWAMECTNVSHLKKKSINEISGGEAQRVWIATVLAQNPDILFLDEPTTYLDISHQLETMNLVKKLNIEHGIGVVMVLHDLSHALEVSDRIIVLKNGEKYDEGAPIDVITSKMMKEVYNVDCDIIKIEGRNKPIIAYKEIIAV